MGNNTRTEDYIDQLSRILPEHRPLTSLERLLIVFIVSTFVSIVGCILLCLIYPRSPLRRKYNARNKLANTIAQKSILVVPPPPSYDSIMRTDEITNIDKLAASAYLNIARKSSNGTLSDSDTIPSNLNHDYFPALNEKLLRSQSARSSLSNGGRLSTISNTYPLAPYAQLNMKFEYNVIDNLLKIDLNNAEHFLPHPAFDEQAEYRIHIQLVDNKLLKRFQDGWKKRQTNLPLNIWKKQQEKSTKNLIRTIDDTLICDECIQFALPKNDLTSTSIRFLLISIDRSNIQDLMFEIIVPLNLSMIPKYEQILQFNNLPQIVLGEMFLGISYLPTSERFTFSIHKFRYFCKTDNKIDARLIITFFHNGRRFFQKKLPLTLINSPSIDQELKEILTQIIPQTDIQFVYVHVEFNFKTDSSISSSTILLGEHTRYQLNWQKLIEYPRQTHLAWYQFYG